MPGFEAGVAQGLGIGPLEMCGYCRVMLCIGAVVFTMLTSGLVFRLTIQRAVERQSSDNKPSQQMLSTGVWIGKCENIVVVLLVLLDQFGTLGLVFAAKGIAQQQNVRDNTAYYLGGTLVNFVWGLMVGVIARAMVSGI
jgi:hypothetical protein